VRWISLGVLVAAGILLALMWGDVPDRWVTHWGVHDQPDGWAVKNAVSAAMPLLLGLFSWLVLEAMALWIERRGSTPATFPREMMLVQATVARAVGLAICLLCAALALVLPLMQPRSSIPIVVGALANIGLVVGTAALWASRQTRRLRAAGVALPEGYKGFFYSNPRDARLWVSKAVGVGWTLNFAHRLAWPALIALVAVPLAVALLITFAAGR